MLSQAVDLDPKFALAWARLGAEHARAYDSGIDHSSARLALARQAIERALALAPDDIEVQIEEGNFHFYGSHDYGRATQLFENVLRIAPNNVDARLQLALVLKQELHWAEAAANLEKVLAIDPRNVGALNAFARLLEDFRYFDRALAVRQQLINIRPDDVDLQARYQKIEYWKSGVWDSFDQWRSTLPPGVERNSTTVWSYDRYRATTRRDFDGLMRLLAAPPEESTRFEGNKLWLSQYRAEVLLAKGDRSRAMATARTLLAQVTAKLRDQPDDGDMLELSSFARAILGERDAALAEHRRAHTLTVASKNLSGAASIYRESITLRALLGDREQALQEMSRQLKEPRSAVQSLRYDVALFSLWDDPAFLAIVNDPANNAPLPFGLEQPPAIVK